MFLSSAKHNHADNFDHDQNMVAEPANEAEEGVARSEGDQRAGEEEAR